MVFHVAGYILRKPYRGDKGICRLHIGKLHFRQDKGRKRRFKDIQFYRKGRKLSRRLIMRGKDRRVNGNEISFLEMMFPSALARRWM